MASKITVGFIAFVSAALAPALHAQLSTPIFPEPTFPVRAQPVCVATSDLDGDGRPDIIVGVAGANGGSIEILRNLNGTTFDAPSPDYLTMAAPSAIAIGDVDGDGDPDIVVTCKQGDAIAVFKNFGDGSFQPASFVSVGTGAVGLALGDLDHDGDLDLVVGDTLPYPGDVLVLANDGTGAFTLIGTYPHLNVVPQSVALGDFDGDGDLDIVTSSSGIAVWVLSNHGDGTFTSAEFGLGSVDVQAIFVVVADLDGDGDLDVAVADDKPTNSHLILLRNDGTGFFSLMQSIPVALQPSSITAVDIDSDGDLDLLVQAFSAAVVFVNDGSAAFAAPVQYPLGQQNHGLAVADFDGDGHVDVVGLSPFGSTVDVARNDGTGKLETPSAYVISSTNLKAGTMADFDGDGDLDLALLNAATTSGVFSLLLEKNDGLGAFTPFPGGAAIPYPMLALAHGDIDGDGDVDLVVSTSSFGGSVISWLNNGVGTMTWTSSVVVGAFPYALALGDFDGDGDLDLAVANLVTSGTVRVLLNNGDGTFGAPSTLTAGNAPSSIGDGDFDGDGDLDLVVANAGDASFFVYANNGDGTFAAGQRFVLPDNPMQLAVGDINGDGVPDLVISLASATEGSQRVAMLTNVGHGQTFAPIYYSIDSSYGEVAICDWNGDGRLDVVANSWAGAWLFANNGDGTFTPSGRYYTLRYPGAYFGSGDLNGDGRPDLVHAAFFQLGVSLNFGPGSSFFQYCYGDGDALCPCNNSGLSGHGCENSALTGGARLTAAGTTSPDAVVLTSTGELPSVLSIALQGDHSRTPLFFGDGLRCASGHLLRLYTKNASGGTVSVPQPGDPSISARAAALGDPIAPGRMRFYQVYYRDNVLGFCPSPGNGWNVSNAVAVQW